jgi:hypothetical protein
MDSASSPNLRGPNTRKELQIFPPEKFNDLREALR